MLKAYRLLPILALLPLSAWGQASTPEELKGQDPARGALKRLPPPPPAASGAPVPGQDQNQPGAGDRSLWRLQVLRSVLGALRGEEVMEHSRPDPEQFEWTPNMLPFKDHLGFRLKSGPVNFIVPDKEASPEYEALRQALDFLPPLKSGVGTLRSTDDRELSEIWGLKAAYVAATLDLARSQRDDADEQTRLAIQWGRENVFILRSGEKLRLIDDEDKRAIGEAYRLSSLQRLLRRGCGFLRGLLASYLGSKVEHKAGSLDMSYFTLSKEAIALSATDAGLYRSIQERLLFLPAAADGRIILPPSDQRQAQFELLLKEFEGSLRRLANAITAEGRKPAADPELKGLADWANETRISPEDKRLLNGNAYFEILGR